MKFFIRVGETFIGVKIDRSGVEIKNLSEIKAKIDADMAAKDEVITALETEAETLKRERKFFLEISDIVSAQRADEEKSPAKRFDRDIAEAYIKKAVRDGRTEDDGNNDYLETLGIRRPGTRDAHLNKIHEWDCELSKRLKRNLDEFRMTTSAA